MTLAVMQPYLFPYIGYWQLLQAVDCFVLLDNVNFIKKGYVNRNSILLNGQPHPFTLSLDKASQNRLINELVVHEVPVKLMQTIENAYKKAPEFRAVYAMLKGTLLNPEPNLALYLAHAVRECAAYMQCGTKIIRASEMEGLEGYRAQERIIRICKILGATQYVNLPGGRALYGHDAFREAGIELRFIAPRQTPYPQLCETFVPSLSIIDVLMHNDVARVQALLNDYSLER